MYERSRPQHAPTLRAERSALPAGCGVRAHQHVVGICRGRGRLAGTRGTQHMPVSRTGRARLAVRAIGLLAALNQWRMQTRAQMPMLVV
ncbi:hypothetical protein C8F00_0896 [Xanthomonas vasicola]